MHIAHFDHKEKRIPHYLHEHVDEMIAYIRSFQLNFDLYNMTEAVVLLHDVGKKSDPFQKYIQDPLGTRGSVKHAIAGAFLLAKKKTEVNVHKNYIMEFVANIIAGHHAGLDDHDKVFFDKISQLPDELIGLEQLAEEEIHEAITLLDESHLDEMRARAGDEKFKLYISMLVRFVMSGLVDADYLSTEAYFSKEKKAMRIYEPLAMQEFQDALQDYIDKEFSYEDASRLNEMKQQVQAESFVAGKKNGSFFTLHAPTGTGKTIASLQFALEHAKNFNKRRIITALPLTNLTEETSHIYRNIFGENHVVEDHSNASLPDKNDGPIRLAAENWNRSFVVSTTVQLFESLFHYRPMKLRKLHRLANSVIILDEYHKLPLHVLEPIFQHLDILQTHFNVTVLAMSATPFPLLKSKKITEMNLQNKPIEITNFEQLFDKDPLRVKFEWEEQERSLDEVADQLVNESRESSVLTIVNTRREAQTLHKLLTGKAHTFASVYYLSTTMCSAHREGVIKEIRRMRNSHNSKKIAVISTSVLETGINISFPVLYRMIAPLDSIIQAAGRCNRYGELSFGRVVIFQTKDPVPVEKSYKAGITITRELLKMKGVYQFIMPGSFTTYYRQLFRARNLNEIDLTHKSCFKFRSTSQAFRMIEDDRLSVICMGFRGFKNEWLYEQKTSTWWRKVQPYTVAISTLSSSYEEVNGVRVWRGAYDATYGILL